MVSSSVIALNVQRRDDLVGRIESENRLLSAAQEMQRKLQSVDGLMCARIADETLRPTTSLGEHADATDLAERMDA